MLERLQRKAEAVRAALQRSTSRSMRRRRWIARISAVALADAVVVALRQLGAVSRLPDLPGRVFDANAVTTSRPAFLFGAPDATLMAGLYSINLIAAGAGGSRKAGRHKLWSVVLAGNAIGGAVGAAGYLWNMLARQKRLCVYCLVAISLNFALVPLAVAETLEDLRD